VWKSRRPDGKDAGGELADQRRGGLAPSRSFIVVTTLSGLYSMNVDLLFLDGNKGAAVEAHLLRGRVPQRTGVQDRHASHGDAAVADHLVGDATGDGRGQREVPVQALTPHFRLAPLAR